jgi:hypothetical protein
MAANLLSTPPLLPRAAKQQGTDRKWTTAEDRKLRDYVEKNGAKNWPAVGKIALAGTRNEYQVSSTRLTLLHLQLRSLYHSVSLSGGF